jgi:hypothetical protein
MDGGAELIPFEDQARLEELVGDMVGVWAQRMVDRGLGAEAAAIAERWRQLR